MRSAYQASDALGEHGPPEVALLVVINQIKFYYLELNNELCRRLDGAWKYCSGRINIVFALNWVDRVKTLSNIQLIV